MKYVIHKYLLPSDSVTLSLEREAAVLYAARDSRTSHPAIWVRRPRAAYRPAGPGPHPHDVVRRTFRVVATGESFETTALPVHVGLVRIEELIFHVFEELPPPHPATESLAEWLLTGFSVSELQRLCQYSAPKTFTRLPTDDVTPQRVSQRAAAASIEEGEVVSLLSAARKERPNRSSQVDELLRLVREGGR